MNQFNKQLAISIYLGISVTSVFAETRYHVQYLGDGFLGTSLNNRGEVAGAVGGYTSQQYGGYGAAVWRNGQTTFLQDVPYDNGGGQLLGGRSEAASINDKGQVFGVLSNRHLAIWDNGTLNDLGRFIDNGNTPWQINSSGEAVGYGTGAGFVYKNSSFSALYRGAIGINDRGDILSTNGVLRDGLWTDFPENSNGNTFVASHGAINNRGEVAGRSYDGEHVFGRASVYANGTVSYLDYTEGASSFSGNVANDLNDFGQVVGYGFYTKPNVDYTALLWNNGKVVDLNDVSDPFITTVRSGDGYQTLRIPLRHAVAINDLGQILVADEATSYLDHNWSFLLTPYNAPAATPEPVSICSLGFGGLYAMRRGKRQYTKSGH